MWGVDINDKKNLIHFIKLRKEAVCVKTVEILRHTSTCFQTSLCPSSNIFAQPRVCCVLESCTHDKQIYSGARSKSKARNTEAQKHSLALGNKCIFAVFIKCATMEQ